MTQSQGLYREQLMSRVHIYNKQRKINMVQIGMIVCVWVNATTETFSFTFLYTLFPNNKKQLYI